jgi:hypothetical protein
VKTAAVVSALVLAFAGLSLGSAAGDSATYDEVPHLGAGFSYGARGDYRLNPEHPPLGKLWASIPLVFDAPAWPRDDAAWARKDQWGFGYSLLYESGNDADVLLFRARAMMVFWGCLLVAAIYAAARERFGERAGAVAGVLACFCPTLLAHAPRVTTDVILTCLVFLTLLAFERFLKDRTWRWAGAVGILAGGTLAAKYSGVLLVPILGWIGALHAVQRGRGSSGRAKALALAQVAAIGATAWLVVWSAYRFRFEATPAVAGSPPAGFVGLFFQARLLPEAWLTGYAHAQAHVASGQGAFALGRISTQGWWWYFPFALLVKTPVPTLAFLSGAFFKERLRETLWLTPVLVFLGVSMSGRLNLGVRHVLPVLPCLLLLASGAFPIRFPRLSVGLAAATALSTLLAAPHFLAYFNEPAWIASDRHRLLVDSNLDWGQDLKRLKAYMGRRGIPEIKLAYFGSASPRQLDLRHQRIRGPNLYGGREPEWKETFRFEAGDVVAISATYLMFREHPALIPFLDLEPDDMVGHSILIYRLKERP